MAMVPAPGSEVIRKHLEKRLGGEVTIDYFTQGNGDGEVPIPECAFCRETGALPGEVAALSPDIRLRVHDFVADAEKARESSASSGSRPSSWAAPRGDACATSASPPATSSRR